MISLALSLSHLFIGANIRRETVVIVCQCGCGSMVLGEAIYLDVCVVPCLVLSVKLSVRLMLTEVGGV